jgi:hypothetical protein
LKEGITSYIHLDEVAIDILKECKIKLSAAQIVDKIVQRYKVGKIALSPHIIAGRFRGMPHIKKITQSRGPQLYEYIE